MRNRNGADELSRATLIVGLVLYVISLFTKWSLFYYLGFIAIIYSLYRVFSKRVAERREENQRYRERIDLGKMRFDQRKEYKIFVCKGCGRKIRVPRKKGKVEITCPICGDKTVHRT